jgi:hypothetical protein
MHLTGVDLEHVLYNYVDADLLETTNFAHLGSVLAPKAAARFSAGSIDGRAVLAGPVSSINGFEFHNFFFNGSVTYTTPAVPPSIHYTFTVTNTGDTPLASILVTDPMVTVNSSPIALAPGESDSTTFTADYFPTPAEIASGSLSNTASVTGTAPDSSTVTDSSTFVLTFPGSGSPTPTPTPTATPTPVVTETVNTVVAARTQPITFRVRGRVRATALNSLTIAGSVTGAETLQILSGATAEFIPSGTNSITVSPSGTRWRITTGTLQPGRNIIKLRALGDSGQTRTLTLTVIKR